MPRSTEKFQLVTYRKRFKNIEKDSSNVVSSLTEQFEEIEIDCKSLLRKVLDAELDFNNSPVKSTILNGLSDALSSLSARSISEIICYGLGQFSQSRCSKYQLALLLTIKADYNCPIFVYDPLFYKKEIQVLETLGFNVIDRNEEGKREVKNKATLLFMPHCSKQLTNNLLFKNWGVTLNNCIFLSNSFLDIVENNAAKNLTNSAEYILRIHPYVTEISLDNNFEYDDIFNGLNIHFFTEENLSKVPIDFWNLRDEPCYQKDAEFIINTEGKSG
ncbi:SRR1-like protein [Prorops nasuta]|uniref:SRR1-like protein n=1 Tax=Prorops nasuta TaxID=863751 RepID=UPI0034CD9C51